MEKTYRAIRHDVVRKRQNENSDTAHHPDEKVEQLQKILTRNDYHILELFAGHGNLTEFYHLYGEVVAVEMNKAIFKKLSDRLAGCEDMELLNTDAYLEIYRQIGYKLKYDIVDADPYGFPNRLFPHIFLLIEDGYLLLTMPKPYVNILNGITQTHLISYYGDHNPPFDMIVDRIALWGLCHWREVTLIDSIDCKSVWRMAFSVKKVKATEYTGVRNQPIK